MYRFESTCDYLDLGFVSISERFKFPASLASDAHKGARVCLLNFTAAVPGAHMQYFCNEEGIVKTQQSKATYHAKLQMRRNGADCDGTIGPSLP